MSRMNINIDLPEDLDSMYATLDTEDGSVVGDIILEDGSSYPIKLVGMGGGIVGGKYRDSFTMGVASETINFSAKITMNDWVGGIEKASGDTD